jgi:chromosomal replication initiation ATPase DnaA
MSTITQDCIAEAARTYKVTPEAMTGKGRSFILADARALAAWLMHRKGLSHPKIARAIGWADHSASVYAVRNFKDRHINKPN